MTEPAAPVPLARSRLVFAVLYGGMTCIAGVLGNKQVAAGPLAVEAGIFAFLLLVALSSATAELHGRAAATALVRWGFAPLVVSIALIALVLALPAAPAMEPARADGFQLVLGQSPRLMAAGILAYGVSMSLNVLVFERLNGGTGRLVWLRGGLASAVSQVVDTLIFVTVAFLGVFPIAPLLAGQLIAKVVLSAVIVPPVIAGLVAWGRRIDR